MNTNVLDRLPQFSDRSFKKVQFKELIMDAGKEQSPLDGLMDHAIQHQTVDDSLRSNTREYLHDVNNLLTSAVGNLELLVVGSEYKDPRIGSIQGSILDAIDIGRAMIKSFDTNTPDELGTL